MKCSQCGDETSVLEATAAICIRCLHTNLLKVIEEKQEKIETARSYLIVIKNNLYHITEMSVWKDDDQTTTNRKLMAIDIDLKKYLKDLE